MRPHTAALSHPESFVVVGLDFPTDLDAVDDLYRLIPGRLFIHLGWVTPEEKRNGSALMHSKVCLTRRADVRRLWVGSHNLTASAMGGANIEAALLYEAPGEDVVIADAEQHLRECRDTAEPYDPNRFDEYKQLQARKAGAIGIQSPVLVLHAEEHVPLNQLPAVIHVRLPTVDFDSLTKTDAAVHFFLHQPGTLGSSRVIMSTVRRFVGRIIEDNRTEHHPGGGSASIMSKATHWLDFGRTPVLIAPNTSNTKPLTQAAIMLHKEEPRADDFLYSVKAKRGRAEASSTPENVRAETAPEELLTFFSARSIEGRRLLFAPREHIRETGRMSVYLGTPIPERFMRNVERSNRDRHALVRVAHERQPSRRVELDVVWEETEQPLGPYFFKSSFRVWTDDEEID
ncbi:MAG: hypothetical protein K1X42_18040 [Opitutaceae bacterium]|nr:hypothetical protein [Opitutaceae bacterium]